MDHVKVSLECVPRFPNPVLVGSLFYTYFHTLLSMNKIPGTELMFAKIKIQWTLSSEEKHKNILRFCQDTIMYGHDVQTELTRVSLLP